MAIVLAAGLIGGGTMAWFTAKAQVDNTFTAGKVMINPGETIFDGDINIDNWNPGDCTKLSWEIHNSGSKDTYIRVKNGVYREKETAMVRMNDNPDDFTYEWSNHPWFTYIIYYLEMNPENLSNGGGKYYLYAAQDTKVGEVYISRTNSHLHVDIQLLEGFDMSESKVNVQLDANEYEPPARFGTWPYTEAHEPRVSEYTHVIEWNNDWDDKNLYIGVHADVWGDYSGAEGAVAKKGYWEFNWEWLWENWQALCFTELGYLELNAAFEAGADYDEIISTDEWAEFVAFIEMLDINPVTISLCSDVNDWVLLEDGYFYYTGGPISPCNKVGFCLMVCFDGEEAGNVFQGATFKLAIQFEAVQASNNAPYHVWGFNP